MALVVQQESSMLEQLPAELMEKILGDFLDIHTRIKLASSNTRLQRQVYGNHCWRTIDFKKQILESNVRCVELMTDQDLSNLLTRINAREVTEVLLLRTCKSIQGSGLEPLRNSQVLRTIRLEDTNVNHNLTTALDILGTMIPHNLRAVELPKRSFANPTDDCLDFMRRLARARHIRARDDDTRCSACKEPVANTRRRLDPLAPSRFGFMNNFCHLCGNAFCGRDDCSKSVMECVQCSKVYCEDCYLERTCCICSKSYCCNVWWDDCAGCDILFCCRNCLHRCTFCISHSCPGCSRTCANDNCRACRDCFDRLRCDVCSSRFCPECDLDSRVCHTCERQQCSRPDCHLVDMTTCDACPFTSCASCTKTCAACSRPSCAFCTKTCAACSMTSCATCTEFERCNRCDEDFCVSHEWLVDCALCNMRHCRECQVEHRCNSCGKACYEGCTCDNA